MNLYSYFVSWFLTSAQLQKGKITAVRILQLSGGRPNNKISGLLTFTFLDSSQQKGKMAETENVKTFPEKREHSKIKIRLAGLSPANPPDE